MACLRYNGVMTRSFAPLLVVAAALVFGGAAVLGFTELTGEVVQGLVAVAVAGVGGGVALLPGAGGVGRAIGTGLVVLGAGLFAAVVPTPELVLAIVLGGLAVTGMRVWISGAGVFVALLLPEGALLPMAAVLAVVVVLAPVRAWWGDLAGAAAGTALVVAGPVSVAVVAALVAAVLLMAAAVRRDLVTGLLAATVLVVPDVGHVWPLAGIVVVALVAIRVPRVRDLVTRLPALRDTRPAYATAGAAVVAASGLVGIALQLPLGWLTLVAVLVAGALGHWLPVPAGPALAVVALVGFGVARPFDLPVLDLVIVLAAVPLLHRHPAPPVFAAAAYLALRVVPWLDPVVTLLVLGAVAAVLAFVRRTAPAGQAMGAVVLGAVAFGPVAGAWVQDVHPEVVLLVLVLALGVSTGWRPSAPLAVAAALAMYGTMIVLGRLVTVDGVVALAMLVAAVALVVAAGFAARRHACGPGLVHRT